MDRIVESALDDLRRKLKDIDDTLQCDMDDSFLTCFLRCKNFDVDAALSCIEKYYTLRKEFPDKIWPRGRGIKWMEPYVALNNCTILPEKNPIDNTRIFAWRKGQWRPEDGDYELADYLTWSLYMTEYVLYMKADAEEHEGWTYIMDLSGFSARHLPYCDQRVLRAYANILRGALPLKVKAIHFVNVPVVFQYVLGVIKFFLGGKLRSRIFVHSAVEDLHKTIDPSILPEDYGGSVKEFSSRWLFEEMLPLDQRFEMRSYDGFKKVAAK